MKDKVFIDTNIFAYLFDKTDRVKSKNAIQLVRNNFANKNSVISYLVIQEFINVALNKFKKTLSNKEIIEFLQDVLEPMCEIYPNKELFIKGITLQKRWKYSFYDSLIIAAALKANCNILYSEDLQYGQVIDDLKIINPFIEKK